MNQTAEAFVKVSSSSPTVILSLSFDFHSSLIPGHLYFYKITPQTVDITLWAKRIILAVINDFWLSNTFEV
jgi:hypothetical protein